MSEARGPGGRGAPDGDGPDEQVGSVGVEAAKLLGALSDWAREHGGELGEGVSGLAGHVAASAREVDENLATGSAECTFCPLCRAVHAVRQTSPEVRAHLTVAAASLMQAAAGLLASSVPDGGSTGVRGEGVEHIDLDDDPEDDA